MATMAKPKALAIPSRLIAPGPEPMLPTTAAPQPKNTRAKVPMNSAIDLFMPALRFFAFVARRFLQSVRRNSYAAHREAVGALVTYGQVSPEAVPLGRVGVVPAEARLGRRRRPGDRRAGGGEADRGACCACALIDESTEPPAAAATAALAVEIRSLRRFILSLHQLCNLETASQR